ncbi:hypothetical protein [Mammaliicoccus sp. A-M4]|uniref:hypothetical protein n=1 Tax=Mammaliicoccus sp. A-M4 TaxID=2898664 RepID=UPI001EFC05BD|nr:hypothetical protein [Mammaliicoccus sp. A-M4]
MPTIKRKVEMNLPQLIEWLLESGKSECIVISNMNNIVQLEPYGVIRFSQEKFYPEETFTVEVEEELTEDTVIDEMLLVYDNGVTHIAENKNLSFISKSNLKSAYYMNDDLRLILIWRDGKLVE